MAMNNSGQNDPKSENQESLVEQKLKKGGPLNPLLFFLLLGVLVFGGFLYYERGNVTARTSALEEENTQLQQQIDDIKGQKVEVSQNAIEALKGIEADEVRWSEVIAEVNKLLPQDASGQRQVKVLSYSGSGQGKIALNMVTEPEALPPFGDVAQLITTFNGSVFFRNAYVPAISRGSDAEGRATLSFVLNMEFEKPETGAENLLLTDTTTEPGESVRVPRNNQ